MHFGMTGEYVVQSVLFHVDLLLAEVEAGVLYLVDQHVGLLEHLLLVLVQLAHRWVHAHRWRLVHPCGLFWHGLGWVHRVSHGLVGLRVSLVRLRRVNAGRRVVVVRRIGRWWIVVHRAGVGVEVSAHVGRWLLPLVVVVVVGVAVVGLVAVLAVGARVAAAVVVLVSAHLLAQGTLHRQRVVAGLRGNHATVHVVYHLGRRGTRL